MELVKSRSKKHITLNLTSEIKSFRDLGGSGAVEVTLHSFYFCHNYANNMIEEKWTSFQKDKWKKDDFIAEVKYDIFVDTVYMLHLTCEYIKGASTNLGRAIFIYFEVTEDDDINFLSMEEASKRAPTKESKRIFAK